MLVITSFFIWVIIEPRSLTFLNPYIEKELDSISPQFSVKIEDSLIKWDRKKHAIAIYASNVNLINDTNDIIATLPEISFGFSALRLLRGHWLSSDLTISEPSFYLDTANKVLYTQYNNHSLEGMIVHSIYKNLKSTNSFKIHSIRIRDAKFFISTNLSDMLWKVEEGYAKLERVKGENQIKSEFNINFGKDVSKFAIKITNSGDNSIQTNINFKDFPSYPLDDLFPNHQIEQKIDMSFSGQSSLLISDNGVVSQARLILDNASGSINIPELFKDRIAIKKMAMDINLHDNLSKLAINNLELNLHGPVIKLSGQIVNSKTWPEILPSINATVSITNLDVNEVQNYWPYTFGNIAWEWVTHNIKDGIIKDATGIFNFSADDIANIIKHDSHKTNISPIPDNAINATINIEDSKVSYLEHFPHAENVKASVKFTGNTMDATIESAKMLSSNISNAHVKFDNLWAHPLKIGVAGDFSGPAQNLVEFLKASYSQKPANIEMASIYNMSGSASGKIDLLIPIENNLKYNDVDIKISANFKDALLPAFINGKNISANSLEFALDKYNINVKGDSLINNIPAQIDLYKNFSPNASYDTKLKLQGSFSPAELKELGVDGIPFVAGKMGLDVNIIQKNDQTTISGLADLSQSTVIIKDLGFEKNTGKKSNLVFNLIKTGKENIIIDNFKLSGDGTSISGNAQYNLALNNLSELIISNAKYGNNNFTASYKSSGNEDVLEINGAGLDLSNAQISEWFKHNTGKIKKSFSFNVNLTKLYMKNSEVLKDFKSNFSCSPEICKKGSLSAKLRDENFINISLKDVNNRSTLLVESDNAGAVINALNISKNITDGYISINSTIARRATTTITQGTVKILNFTAVKTPLLGKILTLASFKGFEDLLNNQGISFKKFEAPFIMEKGLITITNAKSSGASIGITAEGTINTTLDEIDLRGVIVPAYAVNNVFGKIPFVGNIIIGKENEGIIATKYSIKGPYDDAKINVNPLSILTPGFLRNIFDIFD